MPVWDSIVEGGNILPITAFDESKGLYEDWSGGLGSISTSSVRESRTGMFNNGFYAQAAYVGWGDSLFGAHAQINSERQFYHNHYGNDPNPQRYLSINNGNLRMGSGRTTAAEQADWAHYKGYHITADGRHATIADLPNPNAAWDPVRENRGGADNQDVWRFNKYPAQFDAHMLTTIGRYEQSFGRTLVRGKCASGGRLNGATDKNYQQIEAYFAALAWALEAIGFGEDINGDALSGNNTHMPANEAGSGIIPEIDGHENFSDSVKLAHQTLHYFANGAQQQSPSSITDVVDSRNNFIEYGWDLTPGKIGFHINGIYTNVLTTPDSIANPKPIYVKDPDNDYLPLLDGNGVAQTTGTRKHADGSDFYMRWFFLSNLAISSNLSISSFYDYFTNPDLVDDVGAWSDGQYNEIEYILIAPLAVDNPDQNGVRVQGSVDGTDNTGTNPDPDPVDPDPDPVTPVVTTPTVVLNPRLVIVTQPGIREGRPVQEIRAVPRDGYDPAGKTFTWVSSIPELTFSPQGSLVTTPSLSGLTAGQIATITIDDGEE